MRNYLLLITTIQAAHVAYSHVSRNEVAEISVELFAKHRLRKDNSLGKFPPISYHCNRTSHVVFTSTPGLISCHAESFPDIREITGPSGALKITVRAVDPGAGVRELVERTTAHLTVPTDVPDLDQVVSTGRTAVEDAEAAVDVWKPLLDKINKFSEIMVEVSKVMDTASEVNQFVVPPISHSLILDSGASLCESGVAGPFWGV